jgi:hypothetical protein
MQNMLCYVCFSKICRHIELAMVPANAGRSRILFSMVLGRKHMYINLLPVLPGKTGRSMNLLFTSTVFEESTAVEFQIGKKYSYVQFVLK